MFKTRSIWKLTHDGKVQLKTQERLNPFVADMKYLQKRGLKVAAIQIGRL